MRTVAFAWPGLPDYAARCIRAFVDRHPDDRVVVVGTKPSVPIKGMEASLGNDVLWINGADPSISWQRLGSPVPDALIVGGAFLPALRRLADECFSRDRRVLLASDQNWTGSIRQRLIDPLRMRLNRIHSYSGILVPGESGEEYYSRTVGHGRIFQGLYGADPSVFHGGVSLPERPKLFVFVGQFIARKNVIGLAKAFIRFSSRHPEWRLRLCGSGKQRKEIPTHSKIEILDFVQPQGLADIYRQARCLVLPSVEEHWGVVVHEAALSGCALALTKRVGAAQDLAHPLNSALFEARSDVAIEQALEKLASWSDKEWSNAECISRDLAKKFGPAVFSDSIARALM